MSYDLAEWILCFLDGTYCSDSTNEVASLHEMLRFTEELPAALIEIGADPGPLLKLQRRAKRRIADAAHAYRERFEILPPSIDLIRAWNAAYIHLQRVYSELPDAASRTVERA